jgi:hydroxypyruvate isomerase
VARCSKVEITAEGPQQGAKSAEDAGVTLVRELLNSKVDHHDCQCERTSWGVAVCEAVGSPRVKLLYDIYHMQIMEGMSSARSATTSRASATSTRPVWAARCRGRK